MTGSGVRKHHERGYTFQIQGTIKKHTHTKREREGERCVRGVSLLKIYLQTLDRRPISSGIVPLSSFDARFSFSLECQNMKRKDNPSHWLEGKKRWRGEWQRDMPTRRAKQPQQNRSWTGNFINMGMTYQGS